MREVEQGPLGRRLHGQYQRLEAQGGVLLPSNLPRRAFLGSCPAWASPEPTNRMCKPPLEEREAKCGGQRGHHSRAEQVLVKVGVGVLGARVQDGSWGL